MKRSLNSWVYRAGALGGLFLVSVSGHIYADLPWEADGQGTWRLKNAPSLDFSSHCGTEAGGGTTASPLAFLALPEASAGGDFAAYALLPEAVHFWLKRLGVMDSRGHCTGRLSVGFTVHQHIADPSNLPLRIDGLSGRAAVKLLPLSAGQIRFHLPTDQKAGPRVASLPNDFSLREFASGSMSPAVAPYWLATISGRSPSRAFGFAVLVVLPDRTLVSVDILPPSGFSIGGNASPLNALLNGVLGVQFTSNLERFPSAAVRDRSASPDSGSRQTGSGSGSNPAGSGPTGSGRRTDPPPTEPPPSPTDLLDPREQPDPIPDDQKETHENINAIIDQCFEAVEKNDYFFLREILRTTKEDQLREILSAKSNDGKTQGQTLLHYVCDQFEDERLALLPLLLQKVDEDEINAPDDDQRTPLHLAAKYGHVWACELLLTRGASIGAVDENQQTPLHLAAYNGHADCVAHLLEHRANVEATDWDQNTPLHWAASNGHADCVARLLEHGAKTEVTDENKRTPLHLAAYNGHADCVACLLEHGAKIEAADENQQTPLHLAAFNGHVANVVCLLAHGANVEAIDGDQNTPLHLAAATGHMKGVAAAEVLLSWLRGHGKDGDAILAMLRSEKFLHSSSLEGWINALQSNTDEAKKTKALLTEYGVDVNRLLADPPAPATTE
ncbi:MAG: ankyrin repeat domain-containing protein [Puniceicoccales bacterium]|nr:ankyrin repeat domain-containing protein [Puniceicoccales bacterium]